MVKINNLNWMIGGEAGYGIMNVGLAFAKLCIRSGLFVFMSHDYPSLIRGGHNTSSVRVSEQDINSHSDELDILIALNKETIDKHINQIKKEGYLIYDNEELKDYKFERKDIQLVPVPILKISKELHEQKLMSNSIALGASLALVNANLKIINPIITAKYKNKGKEIVATNIKALEAGYNYVKKNFKGIYNLKILETKSTKHYLLSGNEAISLGAIAAGCKFISQYPMTPTTQILTFMAQHAKDYNIAVVQPEDEISSIHMAIGAAFAGIRAMTATSGGGFCLMSEGFGLAGITEIPIVVVEGQRGGPATGLPTRHEQSDLLFTMHSGQGEIARIVLAPSDVEDAFYSTAELFNLTDKFQVPGILLVDKYLCINAKTTDNISVKNLKINRGQILTQEQLNKISYFKRYNFNTESGVSPRSLPGQKNGLYNCTSDEHDETGQLIESPETRIKMMNKRLKKMEFIKESLPKPELFGDKNAEITIVGWGSTKGAIREAIFELSDSFNLNVNHLHIKYILPFQTEEIKNILKQSKRIFIVEDNYSGQLSQVIRQYTGIEIKDKILRYDGKQFTALDIYKKVLGALNNKK